MLVTNVDILNCLICIWLFNLIVICSILNRLVYLSGSDYFKLEYEDLYQQNSTDKKYRNKLKIKILIKNVKYIEFICQKN